MKNRTAFVVRRSALSKRRHQRFWPGALSMCLALLGPLRAQQATIAPSLAPDLQIHASTAANFDFDFRPIAWSIDTLANGNAAAYRFNFSDAIMDEQPGTLQIPYKIIVLGIPYGSRVQVDATPGPYTEWRDLELARAPEFRPDEELGEWRQAAAAPASSASSASPGFYPAELATTDEPARYRYQDVVRIKLAPLQYDAVTKTLRRYESLSVRVRFIGGKTASSGFAAAAAPPDPFYDGLLANSAVAQKFRPARPITKFGSLSTAAAGPLYKINVRSEGLYRITGQFLASKGINLADIDPATLQMFNNGGREVPRDLALPRPQGLEEIRIWVESGNDGRFDASDYILFYGQGVDGFEYDKNTGQSSHYLHHYAFDNVYWLTWGAAAGKRIAPRPAAPSSGVPVVTDFREQYYLEQELRPLYESGLNFYGWLFTNDAVSRTRTYRFNLTEAIAGGTAQFRFALLGWSESTNHHFDIKLNDAPLHTVDFFGRSRLRLFNAAKVGGLVAGENKLEINYTPSTVIGQAYIDYFEVAYDRALKAANNTLGFNGRTGGGLHAYQVQDANGLWFFDVSDYRNVTRLDPATIQSSGSQAIFADSAGAVVPRRYLAASPSATEITNLQADAVSNWRAPEHSADLVIITHEDFYSEALRVKSLHENLLTDDPRRTEVIKIQDLFDEFSGGLYDPAAIRDFLKYALDSWQKAPEYVLLFGDGDHDPKNILDNSDKNWIPTYQTPDFNEIDNRTTDHWFVYIASRDSLSSNDTVMDMAIGRIPVRSAQQAKEYVDKLVAYVDPNQTAYGQWRNTLLFVADDDIVKGFVRIDERIHTVDTEDLANNYTPQEFDIRKLYLTEYPGVQSASISGIRKPSATEALLREINTGALMVNYVGHGAPLIWSDERVLNFTTDFEKIQNGARYSFWVAATCDFGRFDNPKEQSFGEEIILTPGRGAIATLTSPRLVYAQPNATFNKQYYRALFSGTSEFTVPIGLALVQARARTSFTLNDEKFHILGDPTMRLAMPRHTALVTSVEPDTLKALSVMTVRGAIQKSGAPWADFTGEIDVEALDSRRLVRYQSAANTTIDYRLPGNAVFRGKAPVSGGQFTAQFFVPKDITYGGSFGRINLYFSGAGSDGAKADGNGYRDNLPVGGTALNFSDQAGPEISIGFAGEEDFSPGGVVGLNPVLKAIVFDSLSGVNITGEIGHKITLAIDGDTENKTDLTELFNYDTGSFKRGTIFYPLEGLSEGRHTVLLKAWDNFNNSSTASVEFTVLPKDQLTLSEVLNYPNPFRNETTFTFVSTLEAEVRVKIFTLSGRLIRTLDPFIARPGFNMIPWNGEDGDGDTLANGVYLYKLIAASGNDGGALRAEAIGKLVVQR